MSRTSTRTKKQRNRAAREAEAAEALARIQSGDSTANYEAIFEGFAAKGIDRADVLPRENVLTFAAWRAKGRTVRRGEHGVKVTTWVEREEEQRDPVTGEVIKGKLRLPRTATVFHVSQTKELGDRGDDARGPQPSPGDSGAPDAHPTPPAPAGSPGDQSRRFPPAERAEQLRDRADRMQPAIDRRLDPAIGRQNHTARRARIAAGMRQDAYRMQDVQAALRKIADAIEDGTLPECLWHVRHKNEVEAILQRYSNPEPDARAWLTDDVVPAAEENAETERLKQLETEILASPPEGFFPTPASLARRMVQFADLEDGHEVLEPSAGMGHLADVIREGAEQMGITIDLCLVERHLRLVEAAKLRGFPDIHDADFLEAYGEVDRVIMNPPYESGQDIEHVRHAFSLLRPGGRLVALVSAGVMFRQDRRALAFREWLHSDEVTLVLQEKHPEAFRGPDSLRQTGVAVELLVIVRPE